MNNKTVLFSGRFDHVHPGHINTIMRLGQMFDTVVVVVLDYPEQTYPVGERVYILSEILSKAEGNYQMIVNKDNFCTITEGQLANSELPPFEIYASGNEKCIENMRKLGYMTIYAPRSFHYSASELKK